MLPPVLEIYVVWHPRDTQGAEIASEVIEHFHGTTFSGLIGGAVEVFTRSAGWKDEDDAPRPLPFMGPLPNGVAAPRFVAVVPVVGRQLVFALEDGHAGWDEYLKAIAAAHNDNAIAVRAFPYAVTDAAGTKLDSYLRHIEQIGIASTFVAEPAAQRRLRDLDPRPRAARRRLRSADPGLRQPHQALRGRRRAPSCLDRANAEADLDHPPRRVLRRERNPARHRLG